MGAEVGLVLQTCVLSAEITPLSGHTREAGPSVQSGWRTYVRQALSGPAWPAGDLGCSRLLGVLAMEITQTPDRARVSILAPAEPDNDGGKSAEVVAPAEFFGETRETDGAAIESPTAAILADSLGPFMAESPGRKGGPDAGAAGEAHERLIAAATALGASEASNAADASGRTAALDSAFHSLESLKPEEARTFALQILSDEEGNAYASAVAVLGNPLPEEGWSRSTALLYRWYALGDDTLQVFVLSLAPALLLHLLCPETQQDSDSSEAPGDSQESRAAAGLDRDDAEAGEPHRTALEALMLGVYNWEVRHRAPRMLASPLPAAGPLALAPHRTAGALPELSESNVRSHSALLGSEGSHGGSSAWGAAPLAPHTDLLSAAAREEAARVWIDRFAERAAARAAPAALLFARAAAALARSGYACAARGRGAAHAAASRALSPRARVALPAAGAGDAAVRAVCPRAAAVLGAGPGAGDAGSRGVRAALPDAVLAELCSALRALALRARLARLHACPGAAGREAAALQAAADVALAAIEARAETDLRAGPLLSAAAARESARTCEALWARLRARGDAGEEVTPLDVLFATAPS